MMNDIPTLCLPNKRAHHLLGSRALPPILYAILFALILAILPLSSGLAQQATPTPVATTNSSETYTVRAGDSWLGLAARTGLTVAQLKAANPQAVRRNNWLIIGEKLVIPNAEDPIASGGTVTGTVAATVAATATASPSATPTATPTETPTATPTATASPTPTATEQAVQTEEQTYMVAPGESWGSIADKFKTTVRQLQAANPGLVRAGQILYRGEEIIIPGQSEAEEATATATPEAAVATSTTEPTATTAAAAATTESEESAIATPMPVATTDTSTVTQTVTDTTSITSTTSATTTCPSVFSDYADVLLAIANTETGGPEGVRTFLETCGALLEDGLTVQDWTGDGLDDLLVIYQNPTSSLVTPETDLLVLNNSEAGWQLGHRAKAAGEVRLLASEDINGDDQPDIAWIDTTCGASTCFDNIEIYSWTGDVWQDWLDGAITMAYAEITVDDVSEAGQADEIVLKGGVYGSVGAGPQRGRMEVWGSIEGAPYRLIETTYDQSNCIYHVVLDANAAFDQGQDDSFAAAETLYTKAATDTSLTKCWVHENEEEELRSFSLFRLAVVAAHQGKAEVATDLLGSLTASYPGSIYDLAGQVWQSSFQQNNNIDSACAAVNEFASENPLAWETLADYGYANPTFSAEEVCPVFDAAAAALGSVTASQTGVATATLTTPTGVTATTSSTESIQSTATDAADQPPAAAITDTLNMTATVITATAALSTPAGSEASEPATQTGAADLTAEELVSATITQTVTSIAACPTDLAGYTDAIVAVMTAAEGDQTLVETWLQNCGALNEARGAVQTVDLNDDKRNDLIFMPTIVSDLGFGRDGAQGAVLIYHGQADGSYSLVANPDVYGQPNLLASNDLNADGKVDLAWTVEGCSTFCVLETQVSTWDGKSYTSTIQPGAIIAEGNARFEPVADGDPGQGQQLVLEGGVSGTTEGGLSIPHTEIWQSVEGAPFQRIRWTYDREVEGNDCMGLRLIEADVALHAAPVLGYEPAVELYTAGLDPQLRACSIFGLAAEEELVLLQGLASFRLIQAQALGGDLAEAQTALAALVKGQPDSQYSAAAQAWLDAYAPAGDASAACEAAQPIFDKNEELWKITDHFGYNHPALAKEQICYQP